MVVLSAFSLTSSSSSSSGLGGSSSSSKLSRGFTFSRGGGFAFWAADFSTQHLMFEAGHWMFSRTLSHMSEARAWMHLPGHPSALAVLVTEPRKPERNEPKLELLPGLGLRLGGGRSPSSARSPLGLTSARTGSLATPSSAFWSVSCAEAASQQRPHTRSSLMAPLT